MNSYERTRRICKVIVLVLGILSINNIILTIRNYSYAYFEKNVKTGVKLKITTLDEMPSKYATDYLKKKVVSYADASKSDFGGGLVAVNTDGTLYNETAGNQTIREYRYSGLNVNNYIYYNCKDKDEEGHDVEQNADNCEVWRIIGVFKDEDGNEHLKIVRNNVLTKDMLPTTFSANNTTYKIQSTDDYAYWNSKTSNQKNDWATAGLQYWLNAGSDKETKKASDGYMSYLSKSAKDMIEKTKYYLGTAMNSSINCTTAAYSFTSYTEPVAKVYQNERTTNEIYSQNEISLSCKNYDKFPSTFERKGGKIWPDNSAIWNGNIALMYPSDYGYSANSYNWDKALFNYDTDNIKNTSWLNSANHSYTEWFLSPDSSFDGYAIRWMSSGLVAALGVYDSQGSRPALYLKSQAIIFDGDGTSDTPYKLKFGN